jgi:hypothetical protein
LKASAGDVRIDQKYLINKEMILRINDYFENYYEINKEKGQLN